MTIEDKSKMGEKGEIVPKKPLRELSGINPGDEVLIEAKPGELIIRKIFSIQELLDMPIICKTTANQAKNDIRMEIEEQEKLTN